MSQVGFLYAFFQSLHLKMQNSAKPQTVAFSLRLHSVKKSKIQSDTPLANQILPSVATSAEPKYSNKIS
jgi:hypothetical protein